MMAQAPLQPFSQPTIICQACGAAYKDPGGDDSAWRCRKCDAMLERDKEPAPR